VGAESLPEGGVHFRVWAPGHARVEVMFEERLSPRRPLAIALEPEGNGYHSALVPEVEAGALYRYGLGDDRLADPASRFQPEGPEGPSRVVDPGRFRWTDQDWTGPELRGTVLYEMHVGTFTPEGTWAAAAEQLPALADLGINALEIMPVADFPGQFGWGYDGVNLFAPTRLYGGPDDMRRFVNRAHSLGIAVVLDVVYNHLGPDGNVLPRFCDDYFTDRYHTAWGAPFNFDGENSGPVREYILANASYWIDEFHLDGLRIDATQNIYDSSPEHILLAIADRVRRTGGTRRMLLIGENEEQYIRLVRPPEEGGYGLDALWNDDFHHVALVAATGRAEAYYSDYLGSPQELVSAVNRGFLYQGQRNIRQGKHRGSSTVGIEPPAFIVYLQNHDQIGNAPEGVRLNRQTSPGRYRALTALMLLAPGTPLLFQGQEFAASTPFLYFGDQKPEIAEAMHEGRRKFLSQFRSQATPAMQERVPPPADPRTFERSKLDPKERERNVQALALHRDLLALRRNDPAFRAQRAGTTNGAVLGPEAFVLRYFGDSRDGEDDRLLVVNLGRDLHLMPVCEPLLAPPPGAHWGVLWSSEDPQYGGSGSTPLDTEEGWRIPGHSATALLPEPGGPTAHV